MQGARMTRTPGSRRFFRVSNSFPAPIHDDVEMRVEGRNLENLGEREAHFRRQRDKMAGVQTTEVILQ